MKEQVPNIYVSKDIDLAFRAWWNLKLLKCQIEHAVGVFTLYYYNLYIMHDCVYTVASGR